MKLFKYINYFSLFLLTFLLGVQTTHAKTELVLQQNQVVFSVEQTPKTSTFKKEVQPNVGFLKEKFKFVAVEGVSAEKTFAFAERVGGKLAQGMDDLLSAFKSRLSNRLSNYSGFTLAHSDAEIIVIIQKGKTHNLSDEIIDDFLLISCRNSKSISSSELIIQIDNWVNVVQQRGFPYKFNSLGEFNQFSNDLKNGLNNIGLPINDVRIQGSSLRTPNAGDVDLVVFVDDVSFNNSLKSAFGTNQIKKNGINIDVSQMSDLELTQLVSDINADTSRIIFNSKSRTFANSFTTRKISAKSTSPELVTGLNGFKNTISSQYPGLNIEDISIMTTGGSLDLKPFIKL